MSKADERFVITVAAVIIAAIALSDPKCRGFCRSVAQQVFRRGVSAILA